MQPRISFVTLGVADLAASKTFYQRLGWVPTPSSTEQIVFFQLNGLVLGLFGRQALADDAGVKNTAPGFDGIALAYNVQEKMEVAEVLAEAAKAGAKIVKPAQDVFWGGHAGYFADPDGHLWEICWNPFVELDRQGNLRMEKKLSRKKTRKTKTNQ